MKDITIELSDLFSLDELRERIIAQVTRDVRTVHERAITEAMEETARKAAADLIATFLDRPYVPTSAYGEPKGEPTTLREKLHAEVNAYLRQSTYDNGRQINNSHKLITTAVEEYLRKEVGAQVREIVKDMKAVVVAAVAAQVAKA